MSSIPPSEKIMLAPSSNNGQQEAFNSCTTTPSGGMQGDAMKQNPAMQHHLSAVNLPTDMSHQNIQQQHCRLSQPIPPQHHIMQAASHADSGAFSVGGMSELAQQQAQPPAGTAPYLPASSSSSLHPPSNAPAPTTPGFNPNIQHQYQQVATNFASSFPGFPPYQQPQGPPCATATDTTAWSDPAKAASLFMNNPQAAAHAYAAMAAATQQLAQAHVCQQQQQAMALQQQQQQGSVSGGVPAPVAQALKYFISNLTSSMTGPGHSGIHMNPNLPPQPEQQGSINEVQSQQQHGIDVMPSQSNCSQASIVSQQTHTQQQQFSQSNSEVLMQPAAAQQLAHSQHQKVNATNFANAKFASLSNVLPRSRTESSCAVPPDNNISLKLENQVQGTRHTLHPHINHHQQQQPQQLVFPPSAPVPQKKPSMAVSSSMTLMKDNSVPQNSSRTLTQPSSMTVNQSSRPTLGGAPSRSSQSSISLLTTAKVTNQLLQQRPQHPHQGNKNLTSSSHHQHHLAAAALSNQTLSTLAPPLATHSPSTVVSSKPLPQQHNLQHVSHTPHALTMPVGATPTVNPQIITNMDSWKLNQIEEHVERLRSANQPIPRLLAGLLAQARRREQKRTAKRVANRKSASTSRARKKAFVDEMTRANARLRRQATILALLPDMVVVMDPDGGITFASDQVERVLHHDKNDMVGANFHSLLVPASRKVLNRLIAQLLAADEMDGTVIPSADATENSFSNADETIKVNAHQVLEQQASKSCTLKSIPALKQNIMMHGAGDPSNVISDQSSSSSENPSRLVNTPLSSSRTFKDVSSNNFVPMSVVKVKSSPTLSTSNKAKPDDNFSAGESSISSTNCHPPNNKLLSVSRKRKQTDSHGHHGRRLGHDDDFSSLSSALKVAEQSSDALNRNVLSHNVKMHNVLSEKSLKIPPRRHYHMDDVTGETVTANNAEARLSSLRHKASPGKSRRSNTLENSSIDSGYLEESERGYTSSTVDLDSSSSGGKYDKVLPLAPTCTICLIKEDRTTIWCEVTSSLRTRMQNNDDWPNSEAVASSSVAMENTTMKDEGQYTGETFSSSSHVALKVGNKSETKELLLCLRPIRDGQGKVAEKHRFDPTRSDFIASEPAIAEVTNSYVLTKAPVVTNATYETCTIPSPCGSIERVPDNYLASNSQVCSQSATSPLRFDATDTIPSQTSIKNCTFSGSDVSLQDQQRPVKKRSHSPSLDNSDKTVNKRTICDTDFAHSFSNKRAHVMPAFSSSESGGVRQAFSENFSLKNGATSAGNTTDQALVTEKSAVESLILMSYQR